MKTLWRLVKFLLVKVPNPVLGEKLLIKINWFFEDIQDAKAQKDWHRLVQYASVFICINITVALYVFLYGADLNQFEEIIWVKISRRLNPSPLMYAVVSLYLLLGEYYLYLSTFSLEAKYFRDNFRELIVNGESVCFHWPYHYKQQDCSTLIRKLFFRVFRLGRSAIIVIGDFAN